VSHVAEGGGGGIRRIPEDKKRLLKGETEFSNPNREATTYKVFGCERE
jgi:hypothetical protein